MIESCQVVSNLQFAPSSVSEEQEIHTLVLAVLGINVVFYSDLLFPKMVLSKLSPPPSQVIAREVYNMEVTRSKTWGK